MGTEAGLRLTDIEIDYGKELGFGTFSQVYLARSKRDSSQLYAVKVAEKSDKSSNESIEREWQVLERLQGMSGVVQAYDFVRHERQSSLVLEYMRGGELFDRIIEREHYTESEARACAKNLLQIVRNLHAMSIIHRDIKPENLLCISPESDQIKLADFGSAMILDDVDAPIGEAAGTELYLAPEVIHFLYRPTEAPVCYGVGSDIWSCGVVIYVLLAGYPPFANEEGKVDANIVQDIIHARYDFDDEVWDDVSSEAKSLVSSLLQLAPQKRLSATAALNHAWFDDSTFLSDKQLNRTINNIQTRLKPKARLKRGVDAVIFANRARRLTDAVARAALAESNSKAAAAPPDKSTSKQPSTSTAV